MQEIKQGHEVLMEEIPDCVFCKEIGQKESATHDGATVFGSWAYMCDDCFASCGTGTGHGKGQRLILREKKAAESMV